MYRSRIRKTLLIVTGLISVLIVGFVILQTPDSNPEEMRLKYTTPVSHFVKTDSGLVIHYSDQGCAGCPTLVLLHGNNASLHTFQPIAQLLQDKFRVIGFDLPGHGLTGPHPQDDYTARSYLAVLDELLDDAGIEDFHLGGSSMGGWIAWRFALEQPERLRSLILISSAGAPRSTLAEPPRLYLGARIIRSPIGRWLSEYITPRGFVKQSLLEAVGDSTIVNDALIDRYWDLLRYPGNRRAAAIRATTDREYHYNASLSEIDLPTLILWGKADQVTPVEDAKLLHGAIPNSKLVVLERIGHIPMEEAPVRFAAVLREFLEAQRGE